MSPFLDKLSCEFRPGDWSRVPRLEAHHPLHGLVGFVSFTQDEHPQAPIEVCALRTREAFQRRGVASWLMRHLEARSAGRMIDHGPRTLQGQAWATAFYGVHTDQSQFTLNGQPHLDRVKP